MKLTIAKDDLAAGLSIVRSAVATRTTIPVLQNIVLEADEGHLRLIATNLELMMIATVPAEIETQGKVLVPAKLLVDFVNSLSKGMVHIEQDPKLTRLKFASGSSKCSLNVGSIEDFPSIQMVKNGQMCLMDADTLKSAIPMVAVAAATDESRPVLAGVSITIDGSDIEFAGADGFRLAVFKGSTMSILEDQKASCIVPVKALTELVRLKPVSAEPVEVQISPTQISFAFQNVTLISQLLQGTFPNYNQLIPTDVPTKVVLDSKSFQQAIKTASVFAQDLGHIRFEFQEESVTVSAESEESGDSQNIVPISKLDGDPCKIAFNARYIMDALASCGNGNVEVSLNNPTSPAVIRPVNVLEYLHVIMPIWVQWS